MPAAVCLPMNAVGSPAPSSPFCRPHIPSQGVRNAGRGTEGVRLACADPPRTGGGNDAATLVSATRPPGQPQIIKNMANKKVRWPPLELKNEVLASSML